MKIGQDEEKSNKVKFGAQYPSIHENYYGQGLHQIAPFGKGKL